MDLVLLSMDRQLIERLSQATQALGARLEQASMEELLEFIEEREQLVLALGHQEYSAAEREECAGIVVGLAQCDSRIVAKLEAFKLEAATQLQNIAASRARKAAYESSYDADSLFFDRKN